MNNYKIQPFLFPYTTKDGLILIDGGVLQNLDIESAVKRCHEIVDKDEDIILDVVINFFNLSLIQIMTEGGLIEKQDSS